MKLRNKKTGEIKEGVEISIWIHGEGTRDFPSIVDLNEQWEDYTPKEPPIKDEKIRKAVRAWADALEIDEVLSYGVGSWIGLKTADIQAGAPSKIEINCFSSVNTLTPSKVYTIDELCGEDE